MALRKKMVTTEVSASGSPKGDLQKSPISYKKFSFMKPNTPGGFSRTRAKKKSMPASFNIAGQESLCPMTTEPCSKKQ